MVQAAKPPTSLWICGIVKVVLSPGFAWAPRNFSQLVHRMRFGVKNAKKFHVPVVDDRHDGNCGSGDYVAADVEDVAGVDLFAVAGN